MVLWEDEHSTLESLGVEDSDRILLEVRNADLTWPEELGKHINTTIYHKINGIGRKLKYNT